MMAVSLPVLVFVVLLLLSDSAVHVQALIWQEVNVVHVTDVHGWVCGHRHEPELDADYGDFVSLLEHLRNESLQQQKDLFVIDSGDIAEGTGFSDASTPRGLYLWPLIKEVPFSALTIGNHELYDWETIEHMRDSGFLEHWNGTYVTGNVFYSPGETPVGSRYTILEGQFGARIMVFGFLYNFYDACPETYVQWAEDAVQEDWFVEALAIPNIDAYVCPVHMDAFDDSVEYILEAIRRVHSVVPIVFLCGHTHQRTFYICDDDCLAVNSGRYFDTVNFISFDRANPWFEQEYITTSVEEFVRAANVSESDFLTQHGEEVKELLAESRATMDLDTVLGCAPQNYYRDSDVNDPDSMFGLLVYEIVPTVLFTSSNQWFSCSTGGLRYDIYEGDYTRDDAFTASPFRNFYFVIQNIRGDVLQEFLNDVNLMSPELVMRGRIDEWRRIGAALPNFVYTGYPDEDAYYDFIFDDYDYPVVLQTLEDITGIQYDPQLFDTEHDSSTIWVGWGPHWMDNC